MAWSQASVHESRSGHSIQGQPLHGLSNGSGRAIGIFLLTSGSGHVIQSLVTPKLTSEPALKRGAPPGNLQGEAVSAATDTPEARHLASFLLFAIKNKQGASCMGAP